MRPAAISSGAILHGSRSRPRTCWRGHVTKRYAGDLLRDPLYVWLDKYWQGVALASWILLPAAALTGGLLAGMSAQAALQLAASVFVWGVAARTVYVWHVSAFVNSASHLWGYRSYETNDNSRNNLFVGYFAHGEGWHNNHHADPQAAMQGRRAWEFDPVFWVIRLLARLGLAWDVVMPKSPRPVTGARAVGVEMRPKHLKLPRCFRVGANSTRPDATMVLWTWVMAGMRAD